MQTFGDVALDQAFAEEWGRRFGDAWNAHEPETIAAMCTEDVVWNDAALPGPVQGREAVRDFAAATFKAFPDFQVVETDAVYISPIAPLALCPYRMSGTMLGGWEESGSPGTGAGFSVTGIDQWTLRGDLICHYVTYYDKDEMVRQFTGAAA